MNESAQSAEQKQQLNADEGPVWQNVRANVENNRLFQHFDMTLKAMMKLVTFPDPLAGAHLIVKVEQGGPPFFNLDVFPKDLNLAQK